MMTLPVLVPLAGALLTYFLPKRAAVISLVCALTTLVAVLVLTAELWAAGAQSYHLGGWAAPLGIRLYADGLSIMMILMTAAIGLPITIYSSAYFRGNDARSFFYPLWLFLWAGLNGLYLSGDIFNLYVILEIVGLSAVALAALSGHRAALRAALRYLLAAMVASLAYLMGVGLLYSEYGVLDMATLGTLARPSLPTAAAFGLMMLGLLLKTALFPLHFWLPPAHSAAQAPVSAALSALVIKGSFYITLRLWFSVFQPVATYEAGQLIGALGAVAILWGSFQALRQRRLKLLIAHSTVGQIGYLFLIFPLASVPLAAGGPQPWMIEAWAGCIYQALAHGFAKAAIFLAAGVILQAAGSDKLSSMRDIAGRLPTTTFAFALAGVSLIGLPPSGGFVAKWMILKAIIASGQWWWAPVVVIGSLLTAGYVFLMIRYAFKPTVGVLVLKPVSRTMEAVPLVLAIMAVLLGFHVERPLELLEIGSPFVQSTEEGGGR
jgi:multicomponent Na+:H+ antiporter subunit D